jgi:hypothetical protein
MKIRIPAPSGIGERPTGAAIASGQRHLNAQARRCYFALLLPILLMLRCGTGFADQISCVADGGGNDTCTITFPNVLAASTTYPDLTFKSGDTVSISASGCAQTGGSGSTWKRYVDPEGSNSDHLYHGKISIAGATSGLVRSSSAVE